MTDSDAANRSPGRFGSDALKVHEKIFAMLTRERLVVKLPRQRVDELVDGGVGVRFDRGRGQAMKEWLTVDPKHEDEWLPLAREALQFVRGGS